MSVDRQGGFVAVDKPAGPTSHDVVAAVRKLLRTREVGHAGTLDPFATGVLVVMVGELTRAVDLLGAGKKRYRAQVTLGVATRTDDLTGEVLSQADATAVTDDAVNAALRRLVGRIDQVPPAFSAKHVDGQRAYALAREGLQPDLKAVTVEVHSLTLLSRHGATLVLEVECGRGTYIRALARDLGHMLGVGGHLSALRRTAVGAMTESGARPLADLRAEQVLPAAELPRWVPSASLDEAQARRVLAGGPCQGAQVGALGWSAGGRGVLVGPTGLVALAEASVDLAPGAAAGAAAFSVGRRFPGPAS